MACCWLSRKFVVILNNQIHLVRNVSSVILPNKRSLSTQRRTCSEKTMSHDYASNLLDGSVAQICTTIGWTRAHKSSLQLLSHFTERYLHKIAELVKHYTELNNRTTPNMDDLAFVFNYLSINVEEMVEYCDSVHPLLPYDVPCISISKDGKISNIKQ